MRPYRGKRKDNSEWVCGGLIELKLGETFIVPKWSNADIYENAAKFRHCFEVDPATVGQSTGLKDKNGKGKEAYGGDKVLWDWNKVHKNIEGVIEWDDERLAFVITNWYFQNNKKVLLANHPEIEIIGNIHSEVQNES